MNENFKNGVKKAESYTGMATCTTILGTSKIIIDTFKTILTCNESLISVRTKDTVIEVWGSDLKLTSYNSGFLEIIGNISRIELEKKIGERE